MHLAIVSKKAPIVNTKAVAVSKETPTLKCNRRQRSSIVNRKAPMVSKKALRVSGAKQGGFWPRGGLQIPSPSDTFAKIFFGQYETPP